MDEQRVRTVLYAGAAVGLAFFGLSAVPRIREHGAYNALAAGTLVELYNWRAGAVYMRQ